MSKAHEAVSAEAKSRAEVQSLLQQTTAELSDLKAKLELSHTLNSNQASLFKLKLKERGLLLKELTCQINLLKSEAFRAQNIRSKGKQAAVSENRLNPPDHALETPVRCESQTNLVYVLPNSPLKIKLNFSFSGYNWFKV